jgi:uncharacterized protein YjiS (DUF1127 family)
MFALTKRWAAKTGGPRQKVKVRHIMAYVNSSRQVSVSFGDRIVALVKVASQSMQRRRLYLQTLHELNGLTERDLADLGMARGDINRVAYQAAYQN